MKQKLDRAWQTVLRILDLIPWDIIAAYSARATLFIVISFFPFMIMLLSLIRYLPITNDSVIGIMLNIIPDNIQPLVINMVNEINEHTGSAVLPIAAVTTLWSASTGMLSMVKGLNAVYHRKETRNFLIVRGICTLYTLIFMIVLLAVLTVLVFGNRLYQWIQELFPFLQGILSKIIGTRQILSIIVLTLFFMLLYKTVPNRKGKWYTEIPGAALSAVVWMIYSFLFSLYMDHFSSASRVYGSLTMVVLLLIWLYACMYIVFIGAQVNVWLQQRRRGKIKSAENTAENTEKMPAENASIAADEQES